ncbi:MAG: hypothetical protein ACKOA0_07490, partial [Burkholderiaceae bacterium]
LHRRQQLGKRHQQQGLQLGPASRVLIYYERFGSNKIHRRPTGRSWIGWSGFSLQSFLRM